MVRVFMFQGAATVMKGSSCKHVINCSYTASETCMQNGPQFLICEQVSHIRYFLRVMFTPGR